MFVLPTDFAKRSVNRGGGGGGGVQKPKAYFANEFINLLQMITE